VAQHSLFLERYYNRSPTLVSNSEASFSRTVPSGSLPDIGSDGRAKTHRSYLEGAGHVRHFRHRVIFVKIWGLICNLGIFIKAGSWSFWVNPMFKKKFSSNVDSPVVCGRPWFLGVEYMTYNRLNVNQIAHQKLVDKVYFA
jgi:hypothetical protein